MYTLNPVKFYVWEEKYCEVLQWPIPMTASKYLRTADKLYDNSENRRRKDQ